MKSKYQIFSYRVIYAYTMPDAKHSGLIKVADRLIQLDPNEFKEAEADPTVMKMFIEDFMPHGASLKGVWLGLFKNAAGERLSIKLQDIYGVMEERHKFVSMRDNGKDKWFEANLSDVEKAIKIAQKVVSGEDKSTGSSKIIFRPEQNDAIADTTKGFRDDCRTRYLWNAKMRFGKTLCALQVAKDMGYKYTLIITHRPDVDGGWHEDFKKIFTDEAHHKYYSRNDKDKESSGFKELIKKVENDPEGRLVFFASMQYLRGSHLTGAKQTSKYKDNLEKTAILNFPWDFVVIDEAHEGTQSDRGVEVMRYLKLNIPDNDAATNDSTANALDSIAQKNGNVTVPSDTPTDSTEESKPVSPRDGKPITLSLSGTPFNLYSEYSPSEIYTWDYVKEQRAKADWYNENGDDPNPYDMLPRLNIFNLDIEDTIGRRILEPGESEENCGNNLTDEELDEEYAGFNFSNFFKVWDKNLLKSHGKPGDTEGRFVHEPEIVEFFYALAKETSADSNFPFSTPEFRKAFKHTFWLIPGVPQGKALQELLEREKWTVRNNLVANPYFKGFRVINAAGSEQEDLTGKALQDVKDHISLTKGGMPKRFDGVNPDKLSKTKRKEYDDFRAKLSEWKGKHTITLSCGKLTTGVSVPDWTAVFYMKGNDSTSASTYMQTIFRVQTPAVIDGAQKTDCYVFDFSPVRSLKVFADAVRLNMSSKLGNDKTTKYSREDQKKAVKEWLELLPFEAISVPTPGSKETRMEAYDADKLFSQLDAKLIDRVVRSGYADNSIYDSVAIMDLAPAAEEALARISLKITADSKSNQDGGDIKWGKDKPKKPTKKQENTARNASGKKDDELTPEEIAAKKAVDEWNKQRRERMKTLRAMSVRIPLLMYGAEIKNLDELEINNFTTLVDDESWAEFMPPNITKEDFDAVRDCYDSVRFKGSAERIREFAENSDRLSITERVKEVARIFSFFHNPDKETVLTPWRVVNMHMADTIGGYRFFADDNRTHLDVPVNVPQENVTDSIFITPTAGKFADLEQIRVLEINSKTGLYPLYVAYSLFRARKDHYEFAHALDEKQHIPEAHAIWAETLKENLFVVCKTPMAVDITRRTLAGFTGNEVNAICPKWQVPENILDKSGVIKLEDGYTTNPDKLHETDLVGILRAKEEIEKENKRRIKRGKSTLDLIFTEQVQQRSWWEENLKRQFDHNKFNSDMIKFNALVGNPPYQVMDGGAGVSAIPIYNHFVEAAKVIKPNFISMIMPSRWFAGGKGLDSFRENMLEDNRLRNIYDFVNAKDCFNTSSIGGGVNYILWDSAYSGDCKITTIQGIERDTEIRPLNEFNVFIRYNFAIHIVKKCMAKKMFSSLVNSRNPFGLSSNERGVSEGEIELISSQGRSKLPDSKISSDHPLLKKYKILMSKVTAEHAGEPDKNGQFRIVSRCEIIGPNEVCTDSYLIIGENDSKTVVENEYKYIKTRFARFLLMLSVSSINLSADKFQFVPMQDFASNDDIDWTQSVADIDKQLYEKYNLRQPQIDFIEKMIKPMDD